MGKLLFEIYIFVLLYCRILAVRRTIFSMGDLSVRRTVKNIQKYVPKSSSQNEGQKDKRDPNAFPSFAQKHSIFQYRSFYSRICIGIVSFCCHSRPLLYTRQSLQREINRISLERGRSNQRPFASKAQLCSKRESAFIKSALKKKRAHKVDKDKKNAHNTFAFFIQNVPFILASLKRDAMGM